MSVAGGEIGVDTIRVGGDIARLDESAPWSVRGEQTGPGALTVTSRMMKLGCGMVLDVRAHQNGGASAWVEGSVPRMLGADNVSPASLDSVNEAVWRSMGEAAELVEFTDDPYRINRLDVARDFTDVDGIPAILSGLSRVPLKGRKGRTLHPDPARGSAETLRVATRTQGGGQLYDKYEETLLPAAHGRLRFEARERGKALRRAGILFLDDLNRETMMAAASDRFEWCGFDQPVSVIEGAVTRLLRADLTDGQRYQLGGFLLFQLLGVADHVGDRYRRLRLTNLMRESGVSVSDWALSPSEVIRLDFTRGVVREAA